MAYAHAERNLALLRQLEAETRQLLESLGQPIPNSQPGCRRSPPLATGTAGITAAAFSPDGKRLATGDADGETD